jgi:hypothetical protein
VEAAAVGTLVVLAFLVHRSKPSPTNDPPQADAAPPEGVPALAPPHVPSPQVSAAPPLPTAPSATSLDEVSLMTRLRGIEDADPTQALELAREGNRRFPDGTDAAERAAIVVKSLARTGHISEARGEAETMVNRYPGTSWAREVEQHTGAHPHVNR